MEFKRIHSMAKGNGPSTNGMFFKLNDGETGSVVMRGELHEFYSIFENGRSRVAEKNEPGASFRFRVNVVVHEGSGFVAKIWEGGSTVYNQLSDLNDEFPLETTKIKITRKGIGKETTYSILPDMKHPLTKAHLVQIEKVQLLSLLPPQTTPLDRPKNFAPQETAVVDEEIPF